MNANGSGQCPAADGAAGAPEREGAGPRPVAPPRRVHTAAAQALAAGVPPEAVAERWPVAETERDGGVPVTFAARAPRGHEVLLHLNGITDRNREDIEWALLPAVASDADDPGAQVHAGAYLLPAHLTCSYRLVTLPSIPRDAGRVRPTWKRIHEAGVPDPLAGERMPTPLGGDGSVLTLPGAAVHAAWDAGAPLRRPEPVITVVAPGVRLWDAGRHDGVVVLFDAEQWEAAGLLTALRRAESTPPLLLLVSSGDLANRAAFLPHPGKVQAVVEQALAVLRRRFPHLDRSRVLASGQSYGGLAAVGLVTTGSAPAGAALAQSPSLHVAAGRERGPVAEDVGDLVASVVAASRQGSGRVEPGRIELVAGTEEGGLLDVARRAAPLLGSAGHEVSVSAVVGGHDYAWWRHELLRTLETWHPGP